MTPQAIPFTQVQITDAFWAPRREANRKISLPLSLDKLAEAGNLRNLELAARGRPRASSARSSPTPMSTRRWRPSPTPSPPTRTRQLEQRLDDIIALIAAAQRPDGYLNTAYQVNIGLDKRWTNLRDDHELYCAGHLFEAAAAHFQATGKRTLLDVAVICRPHRCASSATGRASAWATPATRRSSWRWSSSGASPGERRYFDLARFFVVSRGRGFFADEHGTPRADYQGEYWQDHSPILEHSAIVGHAVRAGYLYSAAVDVAAETGDADADGDDGARLGQDGEPTDVCHRRHRLVRAQRGLHRRL